MSRCDPPLTAPQPLSGPHARHPTLAANAGDTVAVAWESDTGGPVELRVRRTTGDGDTWSAARRLGADGARSPAVAIGPDGTVAVAAVTFDRTRPTVLLSRLAPGVASEEQIAVVADEPTADPELGVDGQGDVTLVMRQIRQDGAARIVVAQTRDGRLGAIGALGGWGRATPAQLSVAADGTAAAAWVQDGAVMASVRSGGAWSPATPLDQPRPDGRDVAIAAGPGGAAIALWVTHSDGSADVSAREHLGGGWQPPARLDSADGRAREVARPGRSSRQPLVSLLPDGSAIAAWTVFSDTGGVVRAARRDPAGLWSAPRQLAARDAQAAGVTTGMLQGVQPLVGWEEIDGGLLRVRVQTPDGSGRCRDLSPPTGEASDLRLAGMAAPYAVYVDLNRGRVMGVDLR